MKILALDLGTKTGVAHNFTGQIQATTMTLATPKEVKLWGETRLTRRCDPRIRRFAKALAQFDHPEIIVFEDVQFQSYTLQCQLWSAFRTVVWLTFGDYGILECVPVSTLKKFATGHGGATKEMMSAALPVELKNKGYDDNAVDAIWLLKWAQHNLSRIAT